MFYYKLGSGMDAEKLGKLQGVIPQQAFAVMLATLEICGPEKPEASEDDIIDHISGDLKRFSPKSENTDVVPGFVAYYRQMLKKLPKHILEWRQDDVGNKERQGRAPSPEMILDPITGEQMVNVFKRKPVKKVKVVKEEEEYLEDDEEQMPELKDEPAAA